MRVRADSVWGCRRWKRAKREQRTSLLALCRAADIKDTDRLADTLALQLEGARVSRRSVGPNSASANFVAIAEAIIASFGAARKTAGRETRVDVVEEA